jgi:hypothetical protein
MAPSRNPPSENARAARIGRSVAGVMGALPQRRGICRKQANRVAIKKASCIVATTQWLNMLLCIAAKA